MRGWDAVVWQVVPCRTRTILAASQKKRPVRLTARDRDELVRMLRLRDRLAARDHDLAVDVAAGHAGLTFVGAASATFTDMLTINAPHHPLDTR
ncbi:hypothetical protein DMA12_34790 [Amycolatopsis balhimycina DSM 5908]|uniref:Uncharacterized protein n=1 Tax=Amycolatopsis balhimycina DSM 5908 TaxID=1081091 RepID=A0A428W4D5_AMYBA|nr:hypothetical protein [Amycolatopsis balhimycina]RSM37926.1 hypothetical protein DMA12_34790 [Amycolatopsis balhimycina DSM 5908]